MSRSASALMYLLAGLVGLSGAAWSVEPKEPGAYLDQKEFFKPELSISSSHEPLEKVLSFLPNQADWRAFQQARQDAGEPSVPAFIDPRSGAATSLMGAFPVIPGNGFGNAVTPEEVGIRLGRQVRTVDGRTVAEAARNFVLEHRRLLGIDAAQLGEVRAVEVNPNLWQVSIPQTYHGIPVRHGRLVASISHGNAVVFGTETWGNVRGLSPKAKVTAEEALQAGFNYAGGRSAMDEILREPTLEVIPVAPQEHQQGGAFAGPLGAGYRHRLVWTFVFQRSPDDATREVLVDSHSGEVLAFQDINHYANSQTTGGVYPMASTEICPNTATCGTMQSGWPLPFADTGLSAPDDFTNSAGVFNYGGGTVTTTLTGRYVDIVDTCGSITNSSVTGNLDLGGINGQHDCAGAGGSPGNTASSRSAFYEVNKLAEQARGWLPSNPWLQTRLTTNVNLNNTCNAFYSFGGTINFYRSGGGCRNTGEIAGVFDHEWGHALDDNDAGGVLSSSSEGYADIAAIYRLQTSCIGHGFWWTQNRGCGQTADGTGFNANENQLGGLHCDLDCSGFRDADWDKHSDHLPDTALGFVCNSCGSGSGPCGRQVHCAAAPSRQAAWDLVARDLRNAPFNYDSQTAFLIGNKLFYQGSGNIGLWHSCSCGVSSDGCGATNAYMQWLTADDDNGNLNDGTPHMTAIYNAFNRHGIACATPTPQNSGCSGGPTAAPALSASSGNYQSLLSWSTTPGATRYWVLRTEGHAGCNHGKALIAETTGTTYTDSQVANGRSYHYNVVAAGSSPACFGPVSNCATVVPVASPAPVAGFSFACSLLTCSFNGTSSTGTGLTYAWIFGDSATGTGSTTSHSYGASGEYTVTLTVTDSQNRQSSRSKRVIVTSDPIAPAHSYFAVAPCRVLNTMVANNQPQVVNIAGLCGIPSTAKAVSFNVTAVSPTTSGKISLYPGDLTASWPGAMSSINFTPATSPRANSAVIRLATNGTGTLGIYPELSGQVNLLLDVQGYFSTDTSPAAGAQGPLGFQTLAPCRMADTRLSSSPLVSGTVRTFTAQGVCGVPAGATVASLHVGVPAPASSGYITLYPSNIATPGVSTISFPGGISHLRNGARLSLSPGTPDFAALFSGTAGASVHAYFDVNGYFKPDAPLKYHPITPCRSVSSAVLVTDTVSTFQIQGNCGAPVGAKAALLRLVVTAPTSSGDLTVYPSNLSRSAVAVSTVKFDSNEPGLSMGTIIPLSTLADDLAVSPGEMTTGGTVILSIDVFGYFQ